MQWTLKDTIIAIIIGSVIVGTVMHYKAFSTDVNTVGGFVTSESAMLAGVYTAPSGNSNSGRVTTYPIHPLNTTLL